VEPISVLIRKTSVFPSEYIPGYLYIHAGPGHLNPAEALELRNILDAWLKQVSPEYNKDIQFNLNVQVLDSIKKAQGK